MDHDEQTAPSFEPVPDEDEIAPGQADPGDDSDAPISLDETALPAEPQQHVRADSVTLTQGGAQTIEASTVSISQGGAGRINAEELSIQQGGVGMARTTNLTIQADASAFAVVADSATIDEGANVFMLLSRNVSGDVRPVLDWRAALALGGGAALVIALLRRIR